MWSGREAMILLGVGVARAVRLSNRVNPRAESFRAVVGFGCYDLPPTTYGVSKTDGLGYVYLIRIYIYIYIYTSAQWLRRIETGPISQDSADPCGSRKTGKFYFSEPRLLDLRFPWMGIDNSNYDRGEENRCV